MNAAAKVFLDSYGCQMNLYDSELVCSLLRSEDYLITYDYREADIILINTCSVREHAEQRAIGRLRSFGSLKKNKPRLILGVLGCMAERLGEKMKEVVPDVNLVLGPAAYRDLPRLLDEQLNGHNGQFITAQSNPGENYSGIRPDRREGVNAFVSIMRGCDNFCSYCIVPYVRGRERSRSPEEIISEVQDAVKCGFPEVTLLGQNVNSYRWQDVSFPDLLGAVAEVEGLKRLRFVTSHPRDLSYDLITCMAKGGVICPSLHLPAQSGSDHTLKRMNRGYTRGQYLEKVRKLRDFIPRITLTTDLLCGFPGETEDDFQETLDLIREVEYDDAFTFKYSVREGTQAAEMNDDVPENVKIERLERMIALTRKTADSSRKNMIGKIVEVLIENPSPKSALEWQGRTACGRVALVPGDFQRGEIIPVKVEEVRGFSLWGNKTTDN